jgi:hypothetical protein
VSFCDRYRSWQDRYRSNNVATSLQATAYLKPALCFIESSIHYQRPCALFTVFIPEAISLSLYTAYVFFDAPDRPSHLLYHTQRQHYEDRISKDGRRWANAMRSVKKQSGWLQTLRGRDVNALHKIDIFIGMLVQFLKIFAPPDNISLDQAPTSGDIPIQPNIRSHIIPDRHLTPFNALRRIPR